MYVSKPRSKSRFANDCIVSSREAPHRFVSAKHESQSSSTEQTAQYVKHMSSLPNDFGKSSYNSPSTKKSDQHNIVTSSENHDCKINQLRSHAIIYARAKKITVSEALQHLSKFMK